MRIPDFTHYMITLERSRAVSSLLSGSKRYRVKNSISFYPPTSKSSDIMGCFSIHVLQRSWVLVFSFYVIINRRSSVPILKNTSTEEDAWKFLDVFVISRMYLVQTWENRAVINPRRHCGGWCRKLVSFKLALVCLKPACLISYLYLFINWQFLKLKVNIYRFVLLNFNKVMRPGESLHFYWHIQIIQSQYVCVLPSLLFQGSFARLVCTRTQGFISFFRKWLISSLDKTYSSAGIM